MAARVLHVIYPFNSQLPSPRANSIQVMNTCHALARLGARVHLLARREGSGESSRVLDYYGLPPVDDLDIRFLPTIRLGSDAIFNLSFQLSMVRALRSLSRQASQRVLFTRDMLCGATAIRLRRWLRTPVVYEVHALNHLTNALFTNTAPSAPRTLRLKAREQYVYGRSLALVCISAACREALTRTFEVPCAVDVVADASAVRVPPEAKEPLGAPRLLCIGQFYPWKGVDTAVRAMAQLPGASLDLYGGGYYTASEDTERLKRVAAEAGAASRVNFMGLVPPGQIAQVLRRDYIGILPAADNVMGRHFISPLKLFEYMSCSVPVVASDLPPIREIVVHERNGMLFRADDATDLAAQVKRLVDDSDLRVRLARRAFQDSQDYTYEGRAERILALLRLHTSRFIP
ncbi:MAG: glycosyltransferase family 4 protein [Acidobacteriota bacterium]